MKWLDSDLCYSRLLLFFSFKIYFWKFSIAIGKIPILGGWCMIWYDLIYLTWFLHVKHTWTTKNLWDESCARQHLDDTNISGISQGSLRSYQSTITGLGSSLASSASYASIKKRWRKNGRCRIHPTTKKERTEKGQQTKLTSFQLWDNLKPSKTNEPL